MNANAGNWLDTVFFPALHWKLNEHIIAASNSKSFWTYEEAKHCVLLKKYASTWECKYKDKIEWKHMGPKYMLCFGANPCFGYHFFGLSNDNCTQDVCFDGCDNSKEWCAFNDTFMKNRIPSTSLCRLEDLVLPNDAIMQLRSCIEGRREDEVLEVGVITMLKPQETFEEMLVERDLHGSLIP